MKKKSGAISEATEEMAGDYQGGNGKHEFACAQKRKRGELS